MFPFFSLNTTTLFSVQNLTVFYLDKSSSSAQNHPITWWGTIFSFCYWNRFLLAISPRCALFLVVWGVFLMPVESFCYDLKRATREGWEVRGWWWDGLETLVWVVGGFFVVVVGMWREGNCETDGVRFWSWVLVVDCLFIFCFIKSNN